MTSVARGHPYPILGIPIDRTPADQFVREFVDDAKAGRAGYVCVPNVHQVILAHDDPEFARVVTGADRSMSDSRILHNFLAWKFGLDRLEILRGDELTMAICHEAAKQSVPIGLVGGKDEAVLAKLAEVLMQECPGLDIAFSTSPPFRDPTPEEECAIDEDIGVSAARLVIVGLGCPKQERWMARHSPQLEVQMIGVGAAFDFLTGEVATSPDWMHAAGLEWLHRLLSEPARLWRRYLTTSPRFVWLFLTREVFGRKSR